MRRWVNTLLLYDAAGNVAKQEGYWYDGPLSLASPMIATDQTQYALYEDDAGEASSTIIGTADNPQTLNTATTYQVRVVIAETGGATGNVNGRLWEFNHQSAGFVTCTASSSIMMAVNGQLTNGNDTTQRVGAATHDNTNGWQSEDGTASNNSLPANQEAEAVLNFQIVDADVNDSDQILVRLSGMDAYTLTADITVNKPAGGLGIPIVMHGRSKNIGAS